MKITKPSSQCDRMSMVPPQNEDAQQYIFHLSLSSSQSFGKPDSQLVLILKKKTSMLYN